MANLNSDHFSKMQSSIIFWKWCAKIYDINEHLKWVLSIFLIRIDNSKWKKSKDDNIVYVYISRYNSAPYPNQWHNILVFY